MKKALPLILGLLFSVAAFAQQKKTPPPPPPPVCDWYCQMWQGSGGVPPPVVNKPVLFTQSKQPKTPPPPPPSDCSYFPGIGWLCGSGGTSGTGITSAAINRFDGPFPSGCGVGGSGCGACADCVQGPNGTASCRPRPKCMPPPPSVATVSPRYTLQMHDRLDVGQRWRMSDPVTDILNFFWVGLIPDPNPNPPISCGGQTCGQCYQCSQTGSNPPKYECTRIMSCVI